MMATAQWLGQERLRRQLTRLAKESNVTVRDALARTAFAARDAMRREIGEAFDWSSPNTERFVTGAIQVRYRTRGSIFHALIYPAGKSVPLLLRHVTRYTVTGRDRADLRFQGRLAIPVALERGRSGRVPAIAQPDRLVRRDARGRTDGFATASGRALMIRQPGGRPLVAYALRDTTQNPPRLGDMTATVARAVYRELGASISAAIRKTMAKAGAVS